MGWPSKELGDFAPSGQLHLRGWEHEECNWRFGDVMTFLVTADDVLRGGIYLRLLSRTDFRFGPVQMELAQTVELGAGALDLRDALPECMPLQQPLGQIQTDCWESPVLPVALIQMQPGCPLDIAATAFVSVTFFGDPRQLLQEAEQVERPLFKRMADPCLDPCRHCSDPGELHGDALPLAEPESEQMPDSEYNTCEVPSYLYNSWSPEARLESQPLSPPQGGASPGGGRFVWPGLSFRHCTRAGKAAIETVFAASQQESIGRARLDKMHEVLGL